MSVEDRRVHLQTAAVTVLRERGRAAAAATTTTTTTTKEIAAAADVAEGTIFRVFDTKDDLVQAALVRAFDPAPLVRQISDINPHTALRIKVLALVTAHQRHLVELFELMAAVAMMRPPESIHHRGKGAHAERRREMHALMAALITPHADSLTDSPAHLLRVLRLLTFSGTHPHIAHGELLTPQEIVDIVLDGAVVGRGTHDELLASSDRYQQIVESQMAAEGVAE